MTRPYKKASLVERLRRRTKVEGECWVYVGIRGTHAARYCAITVDGERGYLHRASYKEFVGPIPDGINVLHKCDNPPCWRPEHLFLGTTADNVADKVAKHRHIFGERHPWHGHKNSGDAHPSTKITEADVSDIRMLKSFGLSQAAIAREYGVKESCISRRLSGARGG